MEHNRVRKTRNVRMVLELKNDNYKNKRLELHTNEAPVSQELFLPELGHVLKSLALGFGDKFPDEEGSNQADDAI